MHVPYSRHSARSAKDRKGQFTHTHTRTHTIYVTPRAKCEFPRGMVEGGGREEEKKKTLVVAGGRGDRVQ